MNDTRSEHARSLRVLSLAVGALVLVAAAVVAYLAARPAAPLDRGTPAGVVQAYLDAVLDRDAATAAGQLSASSCTAEDFDRAWVPQSVTVDLVDTRVTGDTARVRITVTYSAGLDPLGSGSGEEHVLRLVRADGQWRLTGIPWPLYSCGGEP